MDVNRQDNPQGDFNLDRLATEVEQTPEPHKKPRRTVIWIAGVVGLIILLGAAAFMAVRLGLLGNQPAQDPLAEGVPPGAGSTGLRLNMTPASELPMTPPDLLGMFSRRDGGSLFVYQETGTDGPSQQSGSGPSEDLNSQKPVTGSEVEVVITQETKIYKDVTGIPQPSQAGGVQTLNVQQVLELVDTLDDLTSDTALRVWGERRGDRVVAQIVLYSEMVVSSR